MSVMMKGADNGIAQQANFNLVCTSSILERYARVVGTNIYDGHSVELGQSDKQWKTTQP